MDKKGETFGCVTGIIGAVIFVAGILICIFSRFSCIELDFTEEQRNVCEVKAGFYLIFGVIVIIVSIAVMRFSTKILNLFTDEK